MLHEHALELLRKWHRQRTSLRLTSLSPTISPIQRQGTIEIADSSRLVICLHPSNESEELNLVDTKFGHTAHPDSQPHSSAGTLLFIRFPDGNSLAIEEKLVFVTADRLGFDLVALMNSAMADWRREQAGTVEQFNESCGDFIVDAMERYGLRNLGAGEAMFSREATPEQFRECVFSAMDHWAARCEIEREPSREKTDAYHRPLGE
jgi:hypothetical protein